MPSLLRSVVLGLLAVVAAAGASLGTAAPVWAAFPAIEVTIVSPEGDEEQVWLNEIENPEIETTYYVRNRANPTPTKVTIADGNGISIRQILAEKGLELGYGTIEIERRDGTTLVLDKDDDVDGPLAPTFYLKDNGEVWFIRPSKGPGDYNFRDHFQIGTAAVRLPQTPSELAVTVKASRKKIDPGESITFTTSVKGGPSNARYLYTWNFNDGSDQIVDGNRVEKHEFTEEGKFNVLVTVKIVGTTRSDPGVVKVQVGDPQESDEDREGGGDNTTGTGTSGTATGDSGVGSTYGTDSSSTYTPVTPPTPAAPPTEPTDPPDIATSGTPVEGNLLADASDPAPTNLLESAARAARDGNPKDDGDGAGVPEAAISIAGVLALLGLGAGIESRQGRLPRPRLPRRAA